MSREWPRSGDKMRFLGENGYDYEREKALATFVVGGIYEVVDCDVGDWSHSIKFVGIEGRWNGVMFDRLTTPTPAAPPEAETDRAAAERIVTDAKLAHDTYDFDEDWFVDAIATGLAASLAESRAEIERLKVRLSMADAMATQKSEQYIAERRAHQTTSDAFAKVRAALERIGAWKKFRLWDHEGDVLNFAHEGDATHLAHDNYEAGANAAIDTLAQIARDALSSLSEVAQSESASPSLRDAALEEAAKIAERFFGGPAHTYASENADVYRAQDNACRRIAEAIRALLANPKTAGEGE